MDFLVHTVCLTYNQENYIADAMNGFVMQQTTFPVVSVIIDDASTDHTVEVLNCFLREHFSLDDPGAVDQETDYGHITFARHKSNLNCFFAVIFLNENHYQKGKSKYPYYKEWADTKYVAVCEGDDYWTNPLKLQKQVDFMEMHEEYSMCFHSATLLNECGAKVTSSYHEIRNRDYGPNDIFPQWVVPTASVVYRKDSINGYSIKHNDWFVYGDIVLFEKCAHVGKMWGMNQEMSVYRMNSGSLLQNPKYQQNLIKRMPLHYKALKMNFPKLDRKTLNQLIADSYYAKMRNGDSVLIKLEDFFSFIMASPGYSIKKIYKKATKKLCLEYDKE